MTPTPLLTTQVWAGAAGCFATVMLYELPGMSVVANVNDPLAATARSSPLLFSKMRFEPLRPETVPPTENCNATTLALVSVVLTPPPPQAASATLTNADSTALRKSAAMELLPALNRAPRFKPVHLRIAPSLDCRESNLVYPGHRGLNKTSCASLSGISAAFEPKVPLRG